jgi:hypothetical protein
MHTELYLVQMLLQELSKITDEFTGFFFVFFFFVCFVLGKRLRRGPFERYRIKAVGGTPDFRDRNS